MHLCQVYKELMTQKKEKAYFKAQKFYVKLVSEINKKDPADFKKHIAKRLRKWKRRNRQLFLFHR